MAAPYRVEAEQMGAIYMQVPASSIILAQQWSIVPVPLFTSRLARSLFGIAEVDHLEAWVPVRIPWG